ncbi:MAG TPA: hypothetical protein VH186_27495 [Chloroflexia bacterium]|nr:hypothetical protein [Chloroflexia bacterium]
MFSFVNHIDPANACTTVYPEGVPSPTPLSVADHTRGATVILEGMLTKITLGGTFNQNEGVLEVYRYFKGNGPKTVKFVGFDSPGSCKYVPAFQRAIFYATGNPDIELTAYFTGNDHATDPVDPKIVSEVTAAAGTNPIVPENNEQKLVDPLLLVVALIAGLLIIGLAGVVFWRKNQAR